MSSESGKTREEILAERQEKKKKKAALKNQSKAQPDEKKSSETKQSKGTNSNTTPDKQVTTKNESDSHTANALSSALEKQCKINTSVEKKQSISSLKEKSTTPIKNEKPEVEAVKVSTENKSTQEAQGKDDAGSAKTKAQLRAERRAKQEADRARKLEKAQAPPAPAKKIEKPAPKVVQPVKMVTAAPVVPESSHKVKLFAHLYNTQPHADEVDTPIKVHPSIVQLEAQYSSRVVSGADACCLALLNALKKVVMDFDTPLNQEFSRGLEAEITKCMSYLSRSRPVAVSMVNAVKHLKFQVSQSKGNELECKNIINDWIDSYIRDQLEMSAKAICMFVREKISPGDVILTYGCSALIQQILISVHREGINFRVIVADGRPWLEGRELLRKLVSAGIHCTYVFVNGLSFVMPEVTKILLGAHALLANGYVMSRAGSSQIALLAKTYNVPVLVCCQTHKFTERVQTDSFVYNELGNPDELTSNKGCLSRELSKWKTIPYLTPLNLIYDVTPPDLVSAVVTEIAVLPCTSVPVILRIKPPDVSY